jgi:uncharacterized protein (TIGR02391 family)
MTAFPNATSFLAASPAALGLVALRELVAMYGPRDRWNVDRLPRFYPEQMMVGDMVNGILESARMRAAAGDAIAWLRSHDLVSELHMPGANPAGSIVPTPLGYEVAAAMADGSGAATHAIRVVDLVPAALRQRVLAPLVAGDYDMAITAAFKAVEVRMRERAGLSTNDFGGRLATKFFQKVAATRLQRADRRGDLSDEERLFEGLFGMYRDRAVHEAPHVDSMEYALEVVVGAAHLLRVVEAAVLDP